MNITDSENEEYSSQHKIIAAREDLERKACNLLTSEILQKLNINMERLPRKCQTILDQVVKNQAALGLQELDPVSISLHRSRELSEKLDHEYDILTLKHKNEEVQAKIDRNNIFLANLRKDLQSSKHSLNNQNPNPNNIRDCIKQLKQKLAAYIKSYEVTKNKYSSLNVPVAILPKSLESQMVSLLAIQEEAISLKQKADDITFLRDTKMTLYNLRK